MTNPRKYCLIENKSDFCGCRFGGFACGLLGGANEQPGITYNSSDSVTSSVVEKTELSYGTGLEEITITAKEDPDPNKQIARRRTPVRQIRGVDVNGNTLSNDFYFYRNLLSGTYKQAYDQIYAALHNGVQTINMSVSVRSSDIANIVYCVYYDHPELFWVDSSLTYYMNGSGIVTSLTVNFNGTANELQNEQYYFEKTIAPLINLAASLPVANGTRYSFNAYFGGNQYGSDFSGLDYSATMPSDYNSIPSSSSTPTPHSSSSYSTPIYSEPDYSVPEYSYPDYSEPDYSYPDDDFGYIDDWSDEDWDNYWNELDNGYDDIDSDNYDDWESYYYGDDWYDDWYDDWCYDDYYFDYCW